MGYGTGVWRIACLRCPVSRSIARAEEAMQKASDQSIGLAMVTAVPDSVRMKAQTLYAYTDRLEAAIKNYRAALKEFGANMGCSQ
jgi:hypothetical protein